MRKFVLIAAMVLASASAQAGQSRGLTVASNDDPAAAAPATSATQPAPATTAAPADAPKYVERPSAVDNAAPADQSKSDGKVAAKVAKKPHHESTEARVIYELHRHGIYW